MSVVLRCKLVLVGDAAVGKSALAQMFHSGGKVFAKNYAMTLGVDFSVKVVPIPDTDYAVELFVCDTSGLETFASVRNKVWEGASMVMAVYDTASGESFKHMATWLDAVSATNNGRKLPGVLVATKSDLAEFAAVKQQEAVELANEHGLHFFECSALENKEVETPFQHVAQAFYTLYQEKVKQLSGNML